MGKILFFTYEFAPFKGGIANYLARLATAMSRSGRQVLVLTATPGSTPPEAYRVHRFSLHLRWPLFFIEGALVLGRTIISEKPTVVVTGDDWASTCAAILSLVYPTRYRSIVYGTELWIFKTLKGRRAALRAWLLRRYWSRCQIVIAISEFTRNLFYQVTGLHSTPVRLVPGSVDIPRASPASPKHKHSGLTLLTVARLIPEKGIDVVIRSLPVLLDRGLDVRYHVVGDGPDRSRLEDLASQLHLRDRVFFSGAINDHELDRLWSACDVFVMLSRPGTRVEGFGLVFLEAMAHGKPVVASRCMAIPEVVSHQESGILIDDYLSPQAVAQAIETLGNNPELRQKYGQAGLQMAKGFCLKRMAEDFEKALAEVMKKCKQNRP